MEYFPSHILDILIGLQLIHVNFLPTAQRYIKKRYSIRKIMTFIFQNQMILLIISHGMESDMERTLFRIC